MNGHTTFLVTVVALLIIAVLIRGKRPLFLKIKPRKEDESLGRSHMGIHSHRLMKMSYVDFLGTFLLAILLTYISKGSLNAWLVGLLILGEIQHMYFGIKTETFRWFFMGHDSGA